MIMKKETIIFFILFVVLIFQNNYLLKSYPFGSPGNKTGSVGDGGQNCMGCHYGSNIGISGSISSNFLNNKYIPGNTYTLSLTAPRNYSNYGFEITAEDPTTGANKGLFIITDNVNTKSIENSTSVTHTIDGTNEESWTFDWTAPNFASSSGSVKFYASIINGNGNGSNSGDTYCENSLTVYENTSSLQHEINHSYLYISENKIFINNFINWIKISDLSGKLIYSKNKLTKGEKISIQNEKLHIVEFFSDEKYFSNKIYIKSNL